MHTVSPEERKKLERLADDGNLEAVHFLERNLFFMERGTPFMKAWKLLSDSGGDAAMKRYNAFRRHRRWDPNDTRQGRRRDESETNAVKVESGDEKEGEYSLRLFNGHVAGYGTRALTLHSQKTKTQFR